MRGVRPRLLWLLILAIDLFRWVPTITFETNPCLQFDREKARGFRLNIAAMHSCPFGAGPGANGRTSRCRVIGSFVVSGGSSWTRWRVSYENLEKNIR